MHTMEKKPKTIAYESSPSPIWSENAESKNTVYKTWPEKGDYFAADYAASD